MLMPVVELAMVTDPVYVPAASPLGFAITGTGFGVCGVAVPDTAPTLSQLPPLAVCAVAENASGPVPEFDTRTTFVPIVVG